MCFATRSSRMISSSAIATSLKPSTVASGMAPSTIEPSGGRLAPAFVQTAGFDPLQDEGADYAKALAAAGVKAEHRHYPSLVHGFIQLAGFSPGAKKAVDEAAAALKAGFAR